MSIALAAPHAAAVSAGERAAAAGGNALDAALAAAVMLTVVYPHQCALGGDLIALVRNPAGQTTAIIAAGTAPAAIETVSASWAAVPKQGVHSVTVPGVVAGWQAVAQQGAALGLEPAFRQAAATARAGSPVSAGLARAIESRAEAITADAGLSAIFAPNARFLTEGELCVQTALADTMERLAADPGDFYRGDIARQLVATLAAAGGTHALSDFAAYSPESTPALVAEVGGRTWSIAPPPSAGALIPGVVASGLDEHGNADSAALVAASVRGVAARGAHLGDPRVGPIDVERLLDLSSEASAAPRLEARASGDTAAVVATDDEGWAVTIVQSVYQTFGAGLLDPVTGVLFHNRGSAFTMDAASPARLRPGARPPHTLCPLIVEDAEAVIVAGCQGGRAQPWILAQLFADPSALGAPLGEILATPRWIVGDVDLGHERLTLVAEPGLPALVHEAAASLGVPSVELPGPADVAGHVQLVRRARATAILDAGSDPRADGVGTVFPSEHEGATHDLT
ncbi:gamma-glutamyltransferase [Herbiconiux ginsengi]|uniref:Primary-amine oxidase/gamma-glutamyltranspeptidase / glutathione hydrolase n=1 Tax=Herbiconiux ginsengi TaxID=381665 RepID=A0A1H3SWF5_9MICO|nr:gamma-glutamyltransferase [Herbiconiux ginsengi]SDZ42037.1 primary-amine oxidase/gamma-glutamyltranspeptidase / glutathione hydrolase [Herbiconiux ginsengi]